MLSQIQYSVYIKEKHTFQPKSDSLKNLRDTKTRPLNLNYIKQIARELIIGTRIA